MVGHVGHGRPNRRRDGERQNQGADIPTMARSGGHALRQSIKYAESCVAGPKVRVPPVARQRPNTGIRIHTLTGDRPAAASKDQITDALPYRARGIDVDN